MAWLDQIFFSWSRLRALAVQHSKLAKIITILRKTIRFLTNWKLNVPLIISMVWWVLTFVYICMYCSYQLFHEYSISYVRYRLVRHIFRTNNGVFNKFFKIGKYQTSTNIYTNHLHIYIRKLNLSMVYYKDSQTLHIRTSNLRRRLNWDILYLATC